MRSTIYLDEEIEITCDGTQHQIRRRESGTSTWLCLCNRECPSAIRDALEGFVVEARDRIERLSDSCRHLERELADLKDELRRLES